jgi:hypothetical protein
MPKLPVLSGDEAVRVFQLGHGLLRKLLRDAGLTLEEFSRLCQ